MALRSAWGTGTVPIPLPSLWPSPLNNDGGAPGASYLPTFLALLRDVSTESDLVLGCEEDEEFDLWRLGSGSRDGSPLDTGQSPNLALLEGNADFVLDLGGGFWDVLPSDWGEISAGIAGTRPASGS